MQPPAAPFITESWSTAGWDGQLAIQLLSSTQPTPLRCDISFRLGGGGDEVRSGSTQQRVSSGGRGSFGPEHAGQVENVSSWRSRASSQTALWSEPEKVRVPRGRFYSFSPLFVHVRRARCTLGLVRLSVEVLQKQAFFSDFLGELNQC